MSPEKKSNSIGFEDIVTNAKEIMLQNGYCKPILFIVGTDRSFAHHFPEMPDTHGERLDLMRRLSESAVKAGRTGKLLQAFLISEGWMSIARDENSSNVRPSRDPNRKEVLIVSGLQIDGMRKSLKLFEIVRNQNKKVMKLPEILQPMGNNGMIEAPLLEAFSEGFRLAKFAMEN